MDDLSKYTMTELNTMRNDAFSEYYRLAIRPSVNPSPADLALLKQATDRYEALCEEIDKRVARRLRIILQG